MKINARNVLKGWIVEVIKGATTAHVKIDIGGAIMTSSITNVSVELAVGKDAYAVAKASDVMRHGTAGFRAAAILSGIGGTAEGLGALIPLPNLTHYLTLRASAPSLTFGTWQ
jgi:molybdopterin-binding protein